MITPRHEAVDFRIEDFRSERSIAYRERSATEESTVSEISSTCATDLTMHETKTAAQHVGQINTTLNLLERTYLLVGPGRRGTRSGPGDSNRRPSISSARVIAELPLTESSRAQPR